MRPVWLMAFMISCLTAAGAATHAQSRAAAARTVRMIVRDVSGNPLAGVRVIVSGSDMQETTTDPQGIASVKLADGPYRVRFEHPRYLPSEEDLTVKNGRADDLEVALRIGKPSSAAAPTVRPRSAVAKAAAASRGTSTSSAVAVSLPSFLESHYIGKDPLKESVFACTASGTVRVLQLRDPVAEHRHGDAEEMLYIVAGSGAVRLQDDETTVSAGDLIVIPRGAVHAIERRSKNPLIVLSELSGAPCQGQITAMSR